MVIVEVRAGDATVATVTIDGPVPRLFVVDVVARLELAARNVGWHVRVPCQVTELTDWLGLDDLGQAERREQPRVEEVVQRDEPPA